MSDRSQSISTRRKFLKGAAVASAAAVAAPSVVKAQGPISMRWQSTWPSKDIFHEYANDFAKKVNDMTGGDLKIEVLPAGAVVPAFQLLDAVSKGVLDGGHGVLVYHYGKQTALALWGSGPGYAMDANMLLSWHKYGGGKELLEKIFTSIGANVVSFPYGPMPTQPLGWFKKPITKPEDMQGVKFRTVGISIDVFTGMGAAVNALPGGEIVAAMDRGLLDAAEFNNAIVRPYPGLCRRVQDLHAAELSPERRAVRDLVQQGRSSTRCRAKMRAIIENAVEAASQDMSWKAIDRYSKDYIELQTKDNVKFYKTPDAGSEEAARDLRRGRQEEGGRESVVQGDRRVAAGLRQARGAVGAGHGRQPQDGLRSLLRTQREEADLTAQQAGKAPLGLPQMVLCLVSLSHQTAAA